MSTERFRHGLYLACLITTITTALYIYKYGTQMYLSDVRAVDGFENSKVNLTKKKILIIYWTRVFSKRAPVNVNRYSWPFFYAGDNCSVDCELTIDHKRINEASAIVVHSRNPGEIPPRTMRNVTWLLLACGHIRLRNSPDMGVG